MAHLVAAKPNFIAPAGLGLLKLGLAGDSRVIHLQPTLHGRIVSLVGALLRAQRSESPARQEGRSRALRKTHPERSPSRLLHRAQRPKRERQTQLIGAGIANPPLNLILLLRSELATRPLGSASTVQLRCSSRRGSNSLASFGQYVRACPVIALISTRVLPSRRSATSCLRNWTLASTDNVLRSLFRTHGVSQVPSNMASAMRDGQQQIDWQEDESPARAKLPASLASFSVCSYPVAQFLP